MTYEQVGEKIDLVLEHFASEVIGCEYQNFDFEQRARFRKVPCKVILSIPELAEYFKAKKGEVDETINKRRNSIDCR